MDRNAAISASCSEAEKMSNNGQTNHQHHTLKHSVPFYISPTLFDNRRLRKKRLRWAKTLLGMIGGKKQLQLMKRKKTFRLKQNLSMLQADITIDLLSDDDEHCVQMKPNDQKSVVPQVQSVTKIPCASAKTNRRKSVPSHVLSGTTIDLNATLKQDEQKNVSPQVQSENTTKSFAQSKTNEQNDLFPHVHSAISLGPPPLVPIQFNNKKLVQPPSQNELQQQHYIVYPGHIELSKVPNITLIPVQSIAGTPPIASVAPMPRCVKRKRKSQQPKRRTQNIVLNNESIVLSDDSDVEHNLPVPMPLPPEPVCARAKVITHTYEATTQADPLPQTTITPVSTKSTGLPISTPTNVETNCNTPALTLLNTPLSAQVDEEVTVSIVPRSLRAGNCSNTTPDELFPMLPDETTVHTVIANRTYELSLTKLREGLATCGMSEFANGQQKSIQTRRKGQVVDTPPLVLPPPTPISLKLSSDLSISLISDDEDDDHQQLLSVESLLSKQPQLSIQHLQMPSLGMGESAGLATGSNRQPPRRRKLG